MLIGSYYLLILTLIISYILFVCQLAFLMLVSMY